MLQFFKKSGQRKDRKKQTSSPTNLPSLEKSLSSDGSSIQNSLTRPGVNHNLEDEENDDEESRTSLSSEILSAKSRLSKTLAEILSDKDALGYFIQFMENRGRIALIKFWMEVECVREASNQSNMNILQSDRNDNDVNINKLNNINEPKIQMVLNWKTISEDPDMSSVNQDASRICRKYILKDGLKINTLNGINPEIIGEVENVLTTGKDMELIKCLLLVQKIVYKVLQDEYIDDFLRSEFHCKHQIDVLTSGEVKLADILFNETAFFYFMEFMELENRRELLDFWMCAVNYKQNLLGKTDTNPLEAQTDALIIYDKYFSLQATMPLGFSDKIRFQIEQNICQEGGNGPQPDCFEIPTIIVYNFLSKYYLPAFLSSQLYYKYLSELISTIQSSCAGAHPRVRRAGSDCSSEVSTLSQMGNSEEINRNSTDNSINGTMNIDTKQLYDPDSLWKRTKCSLSVGYVDSMGRFVTEIEPDPHRKYESRISRAVKRLIHMEQDKAKEELAWKIAEMIVREITSLTLGATKHP